MAWCARRMAGAALVVGALGVGACRDPVKVQVVSSVVVTSPIGARLAVGRSAQLVASARDESGAEIAGVALTWTSSAPGVAEVSSAGLVTGRAEGTATITAQAAVIRGTVTQQVLAADLAGARTVLTDPFALTLLGGLTSALKTQLQGAVGQCEAGMDSGNFDTMEAAMVAARSGIAGASDPTDRALTATFALFVDQAYRLLRL
jgi:hypothetical protein